MNKNLAKLTGVYSELQSGGGITATTLTVLNDYRNKAYSTLNTEKKNYEISEVVSEHNNFVECAVDVLLNPNLSNNNYIHSLNLAVNAHYITKEFLDDESMVSLLDEKIGSLTTVFWGLKKNPVRAGCKIKDTRKALNLLKENRQVVWDKLNPESDDQSVLDV